MENKNTFHQANLNALKKIGVANISNIFCKGIIKDKVVASIYNSTNVSLANSDDTHSILHIEFGDLVDNFAITWERTERGTYKVISIE